MAAPGANGGAGNAGRDDGHVAGEERRRVAGLSHAAVRDMKSAPFTEGPQPGNVESEGPRFLRVPLAGLPR